MNGLGLRDQATERRVQLQSRRASVSLKVYSLGASGLQSRGFFPAGRIVRVVQGEVLHATEMQNSALTVKFRV